MHIFKRIDLAFKHDRQQANAAVAVAGVGIYLLVMLMSVSARHNPALYQHAAGYVMILLGCAAGAVIIAYSFHVWQEKRLIENIPTS